MSFDAEIYVLRHGTPAASDLPNRDRPLSEDGHQQASALVPFLRNLGLAAVYTSPFRRAVETVTPFCKAVGINAIEREELSESTEDEKLPQVRSRLIEAMSSIAEAHQGHRVLVCTHGGCLWGIISHFDDSFSYDEYRRIGAPDMRRVVYESGMASLDQQFKFGLRFT